MLRALPTLALGVSIVLSACTVHIHPAVTTPAEEGPPPATEEEEKEQPTVTPEAGEPERPPEPVVPRRRPAPEPEPPPQEIPERRPPIVPQPPVEPEPRQMAWACHGDQEPVWVQVPVDAVESHRRHGDPVSREPRVVGEACDRAVDAPPPPGRRPEPPQPDRPIVPQEPVEGKPERFAWVCHGEENAQWLRMPAPAAAAHRRHGDPVSQQPQAAGTPCERGEPEAPPEQPPPKEPPTRPEQPGRQQFAWVCHGEENPRWLRVAVPSVAAHREHGDLVSLEPQEAGTACERTEPETPPDQPPPEEPPPRPEQPGRQQFAWVCHGEENPRWLRVAMPSVEAHRSHGDPVSVEPREVGTECERAEPETPPEEPPPQEPPPQEPPPQEPPPREPPPQPETPRFVWVCHGQRNPTWQRVAASAAEGHRQHGDPVSTDPQEVGTRCER